MHVQVISILLRKFKVVSNPRKFALYELDLSSGSQRRLRRFEEPLVLQLLWGGDNSDFILSLQVSERRGFGVVWWTRVASMAMKWEGRGWNGAALLCVSCRPRFNHNVFFMLLGRIYVSERML